MRLDVTYEIVPRPVVCDRARISQVLSNQHIPYVFERYWRGRGGEGTGLGLFISKGIVEAHG